MLEVKAGPWGILLYHSPAYERRKIRLYSKSGGEKRDVTGSKRRVEALRKQLEGGGKADG
jgi:hypothetical protein